jgi:hypothetical protein
MKTNFLNKLKQGLFLLIAVLGTFVGYSQSTTTTTIGGSKTPDTGGFFDIGGKQNPQPTLLTNLTGEIQCTFAFLNETGGRNGTGTSSDTGQVNSPDDFGDLDTGGRGANTNTGEFALSDIGGRGTSTDTGQITTTDDWDFFDIGGRTTGGELTALDTGGRNSTGGLENTCTICPETGGGNGGNGGKSTTGEYAHSDTGGRDSGGGLNPLNDVGGRGGTDTGPGQFTIYEIGGRSTNSTGEVAVFDTGGRGNELGGGCIFDGFCLIYTPE